MGIRDRYNKANKVRTDPQNQGINYSQAVGKAESVEFVSELETAIHDMGFSDTYSMETVRGPIADMMNMIQLVLGGIGAVSLFVAALGIINTMIMSIYERTREIGVMKVLGCVVGNIRLMFLMEAGMIGLMGGLVGLGISYGASVSYTHLDVYKRQGLGMALRFPSRRGVSVCQGGYAFSRYGGLR